MRWGALVGIFLTIGFVPVALAATALDPIEQGVTISAEVPLRYGSVLLKGRAVPSAFISFFRNGLLIGTVESDQEGYFGKLLTGLPQGKQTIEIVVIDDFGRRSGKTIVTPAILAQSQTTQEGVILPPTLQSDLYVKRFLYQKIGGGSAPNTQIAIFINGEPSSVSVMSDARGEWSIILDPFSTLEPRTLSAIARTSTGSESGESSARLIVTPNADINQDGVVDMSDLSLLMHEYRYAVDPKRAVDINADGALNATDLAIMFEQWTGL